jgi:hypothetical protein
MLLKLFLHTLVLHGTMCKSSFILGLYECNPELSAKLLKLDFMYISVSYMYKDGRGNMHNDLKVCLQLVVLGPGS